MKCKNCGCQDFVNFGDHYECVCCGFPVSNLDENDDETCSSFNELESLKHKLVKILNEPRLVEENLLETASNILKYDPNDFIADYFIKYLNRNEYPENYRECIKKMDSIEMDENNENLLIPFMINNSEYKYFDAITNMLIAKDIYSKYNNVIFNAKKRLEDQDENYSDVERDVFICYSSNDIDTVNNLAMKIEMNGNTCWYAERNMPKNSLSQIDYKEKIEEAISKSKIFLVVMSEYSMLSDDVKWELDLANKYNIDKRIEYRIQDVDNTLKFKLFFDGLQWIDASSEPQITVLLGRIYDLIHPVDNRTDNETDDFDEKTNVEEPNEDSQDTDVTKFQSDDESTEFNKDEKSTTFLDSNDDTIYSDSNEDEPEEETETSVPFNENALNLFRNEKYEEAIDLIDGYDEFPPNTENLVYYYIGYCFEMGYGTITNHEKSEYFYDLAKNSGPVGSDKNLGECFFYLGRRKFMNEYNQVVRGNSCSTGNNEEAYDLLIKSEEYGNGDAPAYIGLCYKYGLFVRKNPYEAFNCFLEASDKDSGIGAYNLGKCYEKGFGVTQDEKLAFQSFLKSAGLGNDSALVSVGACYYYGVGVSQSYDYAFKYFVEAADHGNTYGIYNAARCYLNGHGVSPDAEKGIILMREAADKGQKDAIEFLSVNHY